jgi:hypothetical protein
MFEKIAKLFALLRPLDEVDHADPNALMPYDYTQASVAVIETPEWQEMERRLTDAGMIGERDESRTLLPVFLWWIDSMLG